MEGNKEHDGGEFVGHFAEVFSAVGFFDFLKMWMKVDKTAGGDKDWLLTARFKESLNGREELGGFARTGDAGDADKLVIFGGVFGPELDGFLGEFGVFLDGNLPFGFDLAWPVGFHVGDDGLKFFIHNYSIDLGKVISGK